MINVKYIESFTYVFLSIPLAINIGATPPHKSNGFGWAISVSIPVKERMHTITTFPGIITIATENKKTNPEKYNMLCILSP